MGRMPLQVHRPNFGRSGKRCFSQRKKRRNIYGSWTVWLIRRWMKSGRHTCSVIVSAMCGCISMPWNKKGCYLRNRTSICSAYAARRDCLTLFIILLSTMGELKTSPLSTVFHGKGDYGTSQDIGPWETSRWGSVAYARQWKIAYDGSAGASNRPNQRNTESKNCDGN